VRKALIQNDEKHASMVSLVVIGVPQIVPTLTVILAHLPHGRAHHAKGTPLRWLVSHVNQQTFEWIVIILLIVSSVVLLWQSR
jgi:hypothetical protein